MPQISSEIHTLIHKTSVLRRIFNARGLYLLLIIPFAYVVVFNYIPIYGILMAFKRFQPRFGIIGSPWAGLYNFQRFLGSPNFINILRNTVVLSIYGLIAGFPFPVILAIAVNHSMRRHFKKFTQSVTFAPFFLSSVIMATLITQLLGMRTGGLNVLLSALGLAEINFIASPALFPHIYVWSGIWQGTGYSAVIYISSLAAVDPTLHEAALIDGASLWRRVWHIDLATIRPVIVIMLILSMGGILTGNLEKTLLLQNSLNITASEILPTYMYKIGIASSRPDYSLGTAIGLFQNVIGIILTLIVNKIANILTGEGMF
jgi:multiple sugar transport system permease protein/putative aldouronate transport system permease protein